MIQNANPASAYAQGQAVLTRTASLTCKHCGSPDLWRIARGTGIIASFLQRHEKKPVQCRRCGWTCYLRGFRENRVWRTA